MKNHLYKRIAIVLTLFSVMIFASINAGAAGPEPTGWYAGDMHVHRSCGGSPEAVSSLYTKMNPQNLSVISLLADMGNGEVQDPATDLPLVNGQDASISTSGRIVHWDAEWHWDATYNEYPHQALGGHVVALGLTEAHQIWEEYTYPIFNWAHQQNGIAGFAHMEYLDNNIPQSLTCCTPIEYPVEVALGASDFISEDVVDTNNTGSGLNPESLIQAYYRLLNCGFRPGLAAGTDYPCNDGRALGSLLTYVQVAGEQMTYRNWIEGIAAGRTVVSRNGHNEFLDLKVNGSSTPGDEIKLTGAGTVQVNIQWIATQNLSGTIELVQNGIVVASQQASVAAGAPASLSVTVDFAHSGWLAARRMGNDGHQVHTGAVFVTVGDAPIRASVADAEFYVQWMDNLLQKTSPGGAWSSYFVNSRSAAQARYQTAKAKYQQIASEAAMLLTITSTSLPGGALSASYSAILTVTGGTSPYTWSIASGSLPTGLSLNSSTGAISGIPTATGTFSFTTRVTDSGNPIQTATRALSITVAAQASYTLWSGTVPGVADSGPDSAVELGVKFRSDSNGYITGIRFYKASTNTGTHVGNLWTTGGTRLATATFTSETSSGWQQVNFPSPVAITASTVYVASYHTNAGHYSDDQNYFAGKGVDSPPLHALADGVTGFNGVYSYGSASSFPNQGWNSSNYWVDVVFNSTTPPPVTLTSIALTPANLTILRGATQQFTATGTYSDGSSQNITSQVTWASSNNGVATINSAGLATTVSAGSTTISAAQNGVSGSTGLTVQASPAPTLSSITVTPANLTILTGATQQFTATGTYSDSSTQNITGQVTWASSNNGVATINTAGLATAVSAGSTTISAAQNGVSGSTSLTVQTQASPGGPILVITSASNPFSSYYVEILRTEGFNAFYVSDIAAVSSTTLASYEVVILGETPLNQSQVTMLSDWVTGGGNLIAMRPDKKLTGLLGLTDLSSTISNGYLLVNTSSGPGVGIVNQTIQYHGTADRYSLNGASTVATLYSNATTATSSPAVTLKDAGTNGGQAAAFTYDLARSIIYTRQGNPAWSGQDRDGIAPIRANDLFYGNASFDPQLDWINLDKVAIPQADEQQRLLANLIIRMNSDKKPLPRFWYFPRNLAAVVVMTGDDHGNGGTAGRFDSYVTISPPGCSVPNWECIRGTSYIFTNTPLSNSQASSYNSAGFEVSLHVDTNCSDWTPSSLETFYVEQLSAWQSKYISLPRPNTNRTHCITWSDYVTQALVELNYGIRLDTNYYYWPPEWISNRPGFFTGSGIPMRFADSNGTLIDVYQAATQMTDESDQIYPFTVNTLLDGATGSQGYYGAFTVNAHTDTAASSVSDAVVSSALARGIPVISARQMLAWLDGRNGSTFSSLSWSGNTLYFSVNVAQGANGLVAMVPVLNGKAVTGILCNGSSIQFTTVTVKGIQYVRFTAANGAYQVIYESDVILPVVSSVSPANGATGVGVMANITATFSEGMDPATINSNTFVLRNPTNNLVPATVTYNAASRVATLDPSATLANSTTYTATIKGGTSGVKDVAGNPLNNDFVWSFTTAAVSTGPFTIWPSSTVPGVVDAGADSAVQLGVKFRSDTSGYITGIRFYKASTNTGTHVGSLWSNAGTRLATATFTGETASGWQQVSFASPVAITANTVYVASYHTTVGHYSFNQNYFVTSGVDNPPLLALANGVSGVNGVFAYGSSSTFPNQGFNSPNYWVDVVFSTATAATLQSIAVTPVNPTIQAGGTQQFIAMGTYSDQSTQNITGQVTWASGSTGVATITSTGGLATGVAAGASIISATQGAVSGNTTLTVQVVPVTLTLIAVTPVNPTIFTGATQQFTATGTYSDGSAKNITGDVTWASSNAGVATISSIGLATGVAAGTSIISATQGSVSGTATLTVQAAPVTLTSIAVTPVNPTIFTGATRQFTATGTYSNGSTQNITSQVTWSSSNAAVATINNSGLATAVSPGTTTISATLSGVTGSTTMTVQIPPLKITTTSLANGRVGVPYSRTLAASGGTPPYTWSIASGSLPSGLSLNSGTGVISGTPTVIGQYSFTAQVTDSGSPVQAATKALNIRIR